MFYSNTGNISAKYETDMTPASYTFTIWAVIYIWQVIWMVYALSSICRRNTKGRVILNPVVLPISFHIFWIASCILNITWLLVWDREYLLTSFIVLLFLTLTGYTATAFQAIATTDNVQEIRKESRIELPLIYIIVQNGVDLIFSWTTVATFLNLSIALAYAPGIAGGNMTPQNAATVGLSLILVIVIGWSITENTVFFKFFKFVYAWYAVLIWAGIGILVKNYDANNPNTILTIVIIVVAVICLGIKIAVYFYRRNSSSSTSNNSSRVGNSYLA